MIIRYIQKVILFVSLYLILCGVNASEDKSVTQVCSALIDFYYNQAMETDEEVPVFDPALPEFKAKFSIMQPIRRTDFGTIKELLMTHCFPDTLTIEEKALRLNVALSHRHLYVFFKQNTDSLHEMAEQCLITKEQQDKETKIAKVALMYDEKIKARPLKFVLIPDPNQQPPSFHIFRMSLKAEANITNNGFKFYWGHNTLIQSLPFAEITRDGHETTSILFRFDRIDHRLFTEERSMKYYEKQLLLKVGDIIKINKTFTNDDTRVLYEGDEFKIIQTDQYARIFVFNIHAEKQFAIRIENSYFFHFSTLPTKNMLNNLHQQRFQGFIVKIGKNYGFIRTGDDDVNIFFQLNKARYEDDIFFLYEVVNFGKKIEKGKVFAVDVFKVSDEKKFNQKRFQGFIMKMGKNYGFIRTGDDNVDVFFHYSQRRHEDDSFFLFEAVNFGKKIENGKVAAVDIFKVSDEKKFNQKRSQGFIIKMRESYAFIRAEDDNDDIFFSLQSTKT